MTKKQFEELLKALKEVKESLDALRQPQYIFVTTPAPYVPPVQPTYPQYPNYPHYPRITCETGSTIPPNLGDIQIHS